jgi:hypothetical protein
VASILKVPGTTAPSRAYEGVPGKHSSISSNDAPRSDLQLSIRISGTSVPEYHRRDPRHYAIRPLRQSATRFPGLSARDVHSPYNRLFLLPPDACLDSSLSTCSCNSQSPSTQLARVAPFTKSVAEPSAASCQARKAVLRKRTNLPRDLRDVLKGQRW